jgi:RimJ/RimL family protein N-acetyltransferase
MNHSFPQNSDRLQFQAVTLENLNDLVPVYNSNPFYLQASTGESVVSIEEIRKDWEENNDYEGSYSLMMREKATGEIVGLAQFILQNPRDNNPWLGLLMIHKEKQGLGYGREFLEVLMSWLAKNGYSSLHLGVLTKNDLVVPFYEKLGFMPYEIRTSQRGDETICMKKRLDDSQA